MFMFNGVQFGVRIGTVGAAIRRRRHRRRRRHIRIAHAKICLDFMF